MAETRFGADSMLGRLSKWLRVMGYDTHYQSFYDDEAVVRLTKEGRIFLSRRTSVLERYSGAIRIYSDHVGEQLRELVHSGILKPDHSRWFRRCLVCNAPLQDTPPLLSMESVPDYILQQGGANIRSCPACRRLFWAGTHRENMIRQLERWGF